jgi:hypothetical protein
MQKCSAGTFSQFEFDRMKKLNTAAVLSVFSERTDLT